MRELATTKTSIPTGGHPKVHPEVGLPPGLPAVLAPPGALAPGHAAGQVAAFVADFPLGRAGSWGAAERVKEAWHVPSWPFRDSAVLVLYLEDILPCKF